MKIKLIVAASENNVIGIKNDLPWHLPDDMKFFKRKTQDSTVIMGKNNYLSIPHKYRPLKNRLNIIKFKRAFYLLNQINVLFYLKVDKINFLSKRLPMIIKITLNKIAISTQRSTLRGTSRGVHSHYHAG